MLLKAFVPPVWAVILCLCCVSNSSVSAEVLSQQQLMRIGDKIYHNETGGNDQYLVSWNNGESFVSAGIGHFIWFPEGLDSPFTESFPRLLAFMQQQGVKLPAWLSPQTACPWSSQAEFLAAKHSKKMAELRALLQGTVDVQVAFIFQRYQDALPSMLASLDSDEARLRVTEHFEQLSRSEQGLYALLDYVNFKGEGTSIKERYRGQGWGLLQVLDSMTGQDNKLLVAFSNACDQVLTRRVANSPQKNTEQKWLAGWRKRCATYADYD